jgi:hypothetical protein
MSREGYLTPSPCPSPPEYRGRGEIINLTDNSRGSSNRG